MRKDFCDHCGVEVKRHDRMYGKAFYVTPFLLISHTGPSFLLCEKCLTEYAKEKAAIDIKFFGSEDKNLMTLTQIMENADENSCLS